MFMFALGDDETLCHNNTIKTTESIHISNKNL
jgi:hypothetical protein